MMIDYYDEPLEVEFHYSPPYRGKRDSFNGRAGAGIQLEPDEPATVEIESVCLESGIDVLCWLNAGTVTEIEALILKEINDREDERYGRSTEN